MPIIKINNIFTTKELEIIKNTILNGEIEIDGNLGRKRLKSSVSNNMTDPMIKKLCAIAKQATNTPLKIDNAMVVEYNSKYGKPNLPPHFDGDTNDLIINMQLESNTSWDIGLNLEIYTLEDNSALVFNANTEIHWRTHKEFKEGEYVIMLFIRFYNLEKRSDYSYVPMNQIDPVFDEARALRDSLV
jgi:hypothetical protein